MTTRNGTVIYVRDVAHVRDGYPPQTNMVRRDGRRGVLMSVLKTGSASTLDIIKEIKQRIPGVLTQLPPGFNIDLVGDQSLFVRGAISGVVREAVIAAALTALMILLVPRQRAQHADHRDLHSRCRSWHRSPVYRRSGRRSIS